MLIDGDRHLDQPGAVFGRFQKVRRRKMLGPVAAGFQPPGDTIINFYPNWMQTTAQVVLAPYRVTLPPVLLPSQRWLRKFIY